MFGPTHRVAADLAALLGRTAEARSLYEEAIALADAIGAAPFAARARRGLASLEPGPPPSRAPGSGRAISLVRDGDVWVVSSGAATFRLKDGKGLHYLDELLRNPGREVHVSQLAGAVEDGDAGPLLDEEAKRAYRRRLEELKDALEEAERFGDPGRAARARAEIEALTEQLAGAVGLGGRDRKVGSQVERARINVQRRLRDAIGRIERHDPDLGRYLQATVKTGIFCSYEPL